MGAKATGRFDRFRKGHDVLIEVAFMCAFDDAVDNFRTEHGREPDWDEVNIRGGSATTEVLVEIEEVG